MLNWCTSVVCSNDLRYGIWWFVCSRIGITAVAKAEGTKNKDLYDLMKLELSMFFFSVVSCYILIFFLKNILTAMVWLFFESSNVLWQKRTFEARSNRHQVGLIRMWYDVINWSFPWSSWFLVLPSLFSCKASQRWEILEKHQRNTIMDWPVTTGQRNACRNKQMLGWKFQIIR